MAKYGMQPNGMMILEDGSVWNPNDPLPADKTQAFNSLPMGSPLNGLGTMAPTAVAPTAPPSSGMFGAAPTPAPQSVDPSSQMPSTLPVAPITAGMTPATPKPSFFQKGGLGGKIGDGLSDFILNYAAAQGNPLGAAYIQQQQDTRTEAAKSTQAQASQIAKLQQFLLEQQYKQAHPEDTEQVRNAKAQGFQPGTKAFNDYVNNSTMAPVITTVNGQPMAYSRQQLNAGISGGASAVKVAPPVGAIEQGHRFMGGNPADPASWQAL